jgi:diacylglycerol kinase family enzyme
LETGEERLHRKTPLVFIGNNRYEVNLLSLGARSCLDAGELSVYLANCTTRWAMLKLVARAVFGRLNQARDFETFSLAKLEVHTRRRKLSVATDGEVCHQRPPLAYRSRPKALRVIVPTEPVATLPPG